MGGRRFNELQRGLGDISPALLTARLKSFEADGLIVRRRINAQRGYEYLPTPACEALMPVVIAMGEWGLCWARQTLTSMDFDVEFLMFYLERSVDPEQIPGNNAVIQFKFTDLAEQRNWWLLVNGTKAEVCITEPSREVDVWVTTTVRTMHDVWMGDRPYRDAIDAGDLIVEGDPELTRRMGQWLKPSVFHDSSRAPVPELLVAA
jgi:hypothetical protein